MKSVFGAPASSLAVVLSVLLALAAGVVTILALRNIVFFRMGVRNIRRRPARSALIVVGLMLGTTIIASALLTGDTMSRSMRSSVLESLGATDVHVKLAGAEAELPDTMSVSAGVSYFDESRLADVDGALGDLPVVDGVAPAIIESIAVQDRTSQQNEPRVTLFAGDPTRLGPFGLAVLGRLGERQVLLDEDGADELAASPGDTLVLLTEGGTAEVTVAGIGDYRGAGDDGPAVLLPLSSAQQLLGRAGSITHVLVSGAGGEGQGVRHTDAIVAAADSRLAGVGLEADPVKRDGLDDADAEGNAFMQLFTTFGSFSMAAGILLIFLIFVMLAAERRSEMGMARAVGTRRGHLVQIFLFEGAAYDVLAAALGAGLGILVSWVMIRVTASAFATEDLDLQFSFSPRSLLIAYAIGVLLTFVVVTASAWRVSRLNIVSAIRDIPEPTRQRDRRTRWSVVVLGVLAGGMLISSGLSAKQFTPWMLGVSLLIVSVVPLVRVLGAPDRLAYTAAGTTLVVWWLIPFEVFENLLGDMGMDFSVWVVGGLLIVIGATWVVTYNADVLLGAIGSLSSRVASLAPVMKMAITYPLRSRFRTAVTLAMFMLVVFTLVTGTTIPNAFVKSFDNVDKFGGGFDVRTTMAPSLAVRELSAELPGSIADDITAVGAQSFVPLEASQDGAGNAPESYPVRGVDDQFARHTTYRFASLATGYGSDAEVWQAVRSTPGLAVVDARVADRRTNWGAGVLPDFQLEGVYVDDPTFEPVPLTVEDPQTGTTMRVTVIGILADDVPFSMAGITVAQELLDPLGDRAVPTVHHLALRPGADADAVAASLERAFLGNGLEAESYAALLDEAVSASMTFLRLIQGFMGLGLLVGVAALGVVSARAVVERRQQIGVLRAIGFQPQMIRRSLLLEASFISLTAIGVGTALGLIMSYEVIRDSARQTNYADVSFVVPWASLGIVFAIVYAAALGTTLLPAIRASRLYPADALRYQ